uniref:Cytochrome P450 n=1 Tax=Marmota marmota marmota TaxID=9994 RepID=A0A8C6A3E7_MARMA
MELGGAFTIFLALCLSSPPGPTPIPFLGNLLQISPNAPFQCLMKLRKKYGPMFTVYPGPWPVVILCGHELVKEALVDRADEFSGRGEMATLDKNFQGHGVAMRSIEERIQEEAGYLLEEFRKTKGAPIDPTFFLSRTVSNVISLVVFGSRFDYEDKEFLNLLQMINESFIEMSTPWAQLYEMYSGIMRYLPGRHKHLYYVIEDLKDFVASRVKVNEASLDPHHPRDFIDCFLQDEKNNPHTEFDLKNLVLTTLNLFFAGTETVSSTLCYGFLLLMKHPEVEDKIHKEINQVIGPHRTPCVEDRVKIPYTDAIIQEFQRLTDIVPMGVPHNVIQDTHFQGYFLPKGTDVFPVIGSVLKDPKYFRYPDAFYPEHFLDEQGCFKKNEPFMPFSSGKRICLGEALARMELFLYFTSILQNFSLRSLVPVADIDITPRMSGFGNIPPTYKLCLEAH